MGGGLCGFCGFCGIYCGCRELFGWVSRIKSSELVEEIEIELVSNEFAGVTRLISYNPSFLVSSIGREKGISWIATPFGDNFGIMDGNSLTTGSKGFEGFTLSGDIRVGEKLAEVEKEVEKVVVGGIWLWMSSKKVLSENGVIICVAKGICGKSDVVRVSDD